METDFDIIFFELVVSIDSGRELQAWTLPPQSAYPPNTYCNAALIFFPSLTYLTLHDDAFRGAYTKAFSFDIVDHNGQRPGERNPAPLSDLAGLKANAWGCEQHRTARRLP